MNTLPLVSAAFYQDSSAILILAVGCMVALMQTIHVTFKEPRYVAGVLLTFVVAALCATFLPSAEHVHLQGAYLSTALAEFGRLFILAIGLVVILLMRGSYLASAFFRGEISSLFQMILMGMLVLVSSHDLVTIFVGLELSSIGLYALIGYIAPSRNSQEGAIKYLILGSLASAFLLFGFALLYASSGTLELEAIIAHMSHFQSDLWLQLAGLFILCGLGFKLALVPFHLWAPDAYEGAPTPLTAFMAISVKAMILILALRFSVLGMIHLMDQWLPVLTAMAMLSMICGNILALVQTSLKRTLAYSSIAHSGYMAIAICCFGTSSAFPYQALLFYLIGYALTSILAFGVLIWLETAESNNLQLNDLNGLAKKHPWAALGLAVAMFSFAGMPPTVGFMGKFFVFSAALTGQFYALVLVGVLGSTISLFFYLRVVVRMYFSEARSGSAVFKPVRSHVITGILAAAVGLTLVLGTFTPERALRWFKPVVGEVVQGNMLLGEMRKNPASNMPAR